MATGYTAGVVDGTMTDFPTFALQCARAFGACVMQRDDPPNDPPKPREVAAYYNEALQRAEDELEQLAQMTDAQVAVACEQKYQQDTELYERSQRKAREARERIDAMLVAVRGWRPPTPEHVGLRDFMLKQLTGTREFDGEPWGSPPQLRTTSEYVRLERERRRKAVEYARQLLTDEQQRAKESLMWIVALYESLGLPGTGAGVTPENVADCEQVTAPEPASICAPDDEC